MSDTKIELNDITNWTFRGDFEREARRTIENGKERFFPIPPFELGGNFTAKFLAVSILLKFSRITWNHGGFLNQFYPFPLNNLSAPKGTAMTESKLLIVNRTKIISFPRLSGSSYRLIYTPRRWFRDVRLRLWQYRGEEFNFTEDTLKRIEDKLNEL